MMYRVTFTGRELPLKLRNIAQRESEESGFLLSIRSVRCGRGCAHGWTYSRGWGTYHIVLYLAGRKDEAPTTSKGRHVYRYDDDANKYLLIHELAHAADTNRGHTDTFYREAIRIAKREGCLRGFLTYQGGRAKAYYRRARRQAA